MAFEHYIRAGSRRLRCGYTTGVCAALAASGAAEYLLGGQKPPEVSLVTEKGISVRIPVFGCGICAEDAKAVWCSVLKDAGDDADVTDGIEVCATLSLCAEEGIHIDGGSGVGRVTKPGLDQPVGNAAINSVPRQMIADAVQAVCRQYGYPGGIRVVISIPAGGKIAAQTLNAMLGVEGGLSILGTSGIVEPMSEQALRDTIEVNIRQVAAESKDLILTPGNYGERFIEMENIKRYGVPVVKCSNFIGDALDMAAAEGFARVLLAGHIGKLVKIAAGIMNTHSSYADGRNEVFCAHTALCGGQTGLCRKLMEAATADACIALLDAAKQRRQVMDSILRAVQRRLSHRAGGSFRIGAVTFSNRYGVLGQTELAGEIMEAWQICGRSKAALRNDETAVK